MLASLSPVLIWLAVAILLAIAEIFTVSFFALVLAAGALAGAGAAWGGLGSAGQVLVSAGVALVGLGMLWRWRQSRRDSAPPDSSDSADWLDHDQQIVISADRWDVRGATRVTYRGTDWDAVLEPGHAVPDVTLGTLRYRIVRFSGNQLVLAPISSLPIVPSQD